MNTQLTLFDHKTIGWQAPSDLNADQWREFGRNIGKADAALNWIVGDWLLAHRGEWGEMYDEAGELTGWSYQKLRDCKMTSEAFDLLDRSNKLSWTHHYRIASRASDNALDYLRRAEADGLSVRGTIAMIEADKAPPPASLDKLRQTSYIFCMRCDQPKLVTGFDKRNVIRCDCGYSSRLDGWYNLDGLNLPDHCPTCKTRTLYSSGGPVICTGCETEWDNRQAITPTCLDCGARLMPNDIALGIPLCKSCERATPNAERLPDWVANPDQPEPLESDDDSQPATFETCPTCGEGAYFPSGGWKCNSCGRRCSRLEAQYSHAFDNYCRACHLATHQPEPDPEPDYGYNYKRDAKTIVAQDAYTPHGRDACQTPGYALDPLLPYLRQDAIIWEPAQGEGLLVEAFYDASRTIFGSDLITGENFLNWEPDEEYDIIVTNPPFSIKFKWLERCYELGKPFALLLPLETLGTQTAQELFKAHGMQLILLNRRVDFKMPNKGWDGGGAQFPVAWFTWGLNLPSEIVYAEITKDQ